MLWLIPILAFIADCALQNTDQPVEETPDNRDFFEQPTSYEKAVDQYAEVCSELPYDFSRDVGCGVAINTSDITNPEASETSLYVPPEGSPQEESIQNLIQGGECLIDCTWPTMTDDFGYAECSVRITAGSYGAIHDVENLTTEGHPEYSSEIPEECKTIYDQ